MLRHSVAAMLHSFPLPEIISSFPNANVSVKMGRKKKRDCVHITDHRIEPALSRLKVHLNSNPFSVGVEGVEENSSLKCNVMILPEVDTCSSCCRPLLGFGKAQIFPVEAPYQKDSQFIWLYIFEQTFSLTTQNKGRLRSKITDCQLCDLLTITTTRLPPDLTAILQSKAQCYCSR